MAKEREHATNLTRFYMLLLLGEGPKHGYEIMKELEKKVDKKPSPGQIYPLLSKMERGGLIVHEKIKIGDKEKKVYSLTKEGRKARTRLIDRFSDIVSIILEPKLTKCAHCGCKIYEGGHQEIIEGKKLMFCCVHCAESYKRSL
ncbi:MAG: PadR family transcriptional regulator [Candidatus Hadarchaeaceae archaeon]